MTIQNHAVFGQHRKPVPLPAVRHGASKMSETEAAAHQAYERAGPTVRSVAAAVASYYELQPWMLFEKRRFVMITKRRQIAFAIVKNRTNWGLPEIGRRFGDFHHTTVLCGLRAADRNAVAAISALLDEVRG